MSPDDEIVIKVDNVSKDFILPHEKINTLKGVFTSIPRLHHGSREVQHALRDINFEVKKGEFFGVVGRNGSGKSTLLKILAGIYQSTKGSVQVHGKLVPFIELGVGFNGELTGRENVYLNGAMLGFSRQEVDGMYKDIVSFAELGKFMDQKLKNYSSGMQVRLAFSMATRAKADILLVDEVLAVGDADFQRKCFNYFRTLKRNKKTVVFVSHDMSAVREYCERAILIEKSRIVAAGDAEEVANDYARMFLEKTTDGGEIAKGKRWGDGKITYDSVRVKQTDDARKKIIVSTEAVAHETVESPNFGFLIRNAGGSVLLGTNSQIKHKFVDHLTKGERVSVQWEFDNILNDGMYFVEPAIVHSGTATADWWEEAASFEVLKEEKTSYPVNPPILLKFNVHANQIKK